MIKSKNHKRIFYRPGMISLVFIPLLCLYYFYKNDVFKEFRCFQVIGFVEKDKFINEYKIPTLRKYKELNFNNSLVFENGILNKLQADLRQLKKKNDTINGIKIHFGKKTDYAVFVKVLDLFAIEDIPTYFIYKDDIWVLVPPTRKLNVGKINNKPIQMYICISGRMSKEDKLRQKEQIEREKFQLRVSFFKKHWMLFLAYFGIVLLNIFALIKFNKNQKVS